MITIEEIIAAHLAVRTEAEWNELSDDEHNDEYNAVATTLGIDDVSVSYAIANIAGHDVFATEAETGNWGMRDFEGVMDSYRRAIAGADSE